MNIIKLASVSLLTLITGLSARATIGLSGTALLNVPGLSVGDVAFIIVDNNNSGFGSIDLLEGAAINNFESYGDFTILSSKTAAQGGSNIFVNATVAGVTLGGGVTSGDRFAIVVFGSSTTTAIGDDTYTIWTDPTWVIPADSNTITFSTSGAVGTGRQFTGASATPAFVKTIATAAIPEPSSFAALAGFGILGVVATRRRRSV